MKKFLLFAVALTFSLTAVAQDKNLFNHLSAGIGVGTDGLPSFDVAVPCTNYLGIRVGYGIVPKFKYKKEFDYKYKGNDYTAKGEFKTHLGAFKMLFDVYPAPKSSSFHVTAGFYIGSGDALTLKNVTSPLPGILPVDYGTGTISLGDPSLKKMIGTDPEGNVKGRVKVNSFRPYLGIGFGRDIPKKLCSVNFDLGVQFWGKPKLQVWKFDQDLNLNGTVTDKSEWVTFTKDDFKENPATGYDGDDDVYDVMKVVEKLKVYPVLSLRVGFRCF